jgi:tripeptidyl-peptidase-1
MVGATLVWSSLFSLAAASYSIRPRVVHSSRSDTPQGFASLGAAPANKSIKLRFAIASKDAPGLEKALLDVSTPSSSNYGNHLTKDEVSGSLYTL